MKQNLTAKLIFFMGLISFTWIFPACDKSKDNPSSKGNPPPVEVSVITVQPGQASLTIELSGRVSAFLMAEVRPQVGGIVQKVLFTEGSEVKEGQILYQIEPGLFQAASDSAIAALKRAEALLLPARAKAERFRQLAGSDAISRQDLDDAEAAFKKAEADVMSARADVDRSRINLAYSSVKAPISGRTGKSSITTGALVTAFQPVALATIQKLDPVYVDVTQSSASLLRIKQSMEKGLIKKDQENQARVSLILEDGSLYGREGVLKFSDITVDTGTGSVTIRCVFPNPDLTLLPGMFVRAIVEEGVNQSAILIPQRCVTRNAKGIPTATIVSPEGVVEIRELEIDRAIENRWVISKGLAAGEKVVIEGLQKARPGSTVKTIPFDVQK